jgi:hypothetical protein
MPNQSERAIDDRRERHRAAQARYRKTHAATLAEARKVAAFLARRKWYASDMARLAEMLRGLLGEVGVMALVQELRRPPEHQAKVQRGRRKAPPPHAGDQP